AAWRLYLWANTPHSGTSGMPRTNRRALKRPMNWSRSASGTPIEVSSDGSRAKTWLTPRPSTIEVIQKTATSAGHPRRPVVDIRRSLLETRSATGPRYARRRRCPMDRWLARIIVAQGRWAKPFGDFNHRWLHALFRPIPAIRDLLNGRWLGHPP